MSLAGKFFIHSDGDFYQFGQIVEQHGDVLLIEQFSPADHPHPAPPFLIAIRLADILQSATADGVEVKWQLFPTREAMDAFVAWLHDESVDAALEEFEDSLGGAPPVERLN